MTAGLCCSILAERARLHAAILGRPAHNIIVSMMVSLSITITCLGKPRMLAVQQSLVSSLVLYQEKIWSSKALSSSTKLQFLQTIVMTVLLYSGETWSLLDKHLHQLSVFHMRCLRRICGISLLDHITNSVILKRCETFPVESQLRSKRLRWFGHICRMAVTADCPNYSCMDSQ